MQFFLSRTSILCVLALGIGAFTYANIRDDAGGADVWLTNTKNEPSLSFEIRAAARENIKDYQPRKNKHGEGLFVSKSPNVSNSDIDRTRVVRHLLAEEPEFEVQIELSERGAEQLANLTEERIGKQIALLIDGVVQAAPLVKARVSSRIITLGGFQSEAEAERVAYGIIGIRGNINVERTAKAPAP